MAEGPTPRLGGIAALAEPVRRRLYEFVAAAGGPVDRDAAAAGVGIGRPLAAFHLDRLVEAGLLDVQFHRRSGRRGPGAGRPAKFYVRPADREVSLSLPPRRYDLAAQILAEGVDRDEDAIAAVLEAAREQGARLAETVTAGDEADREPADGDASPVDLGALLELLTSHGYEPFVDEDGVVRLRNCPFHALVDRHRDLTCSMNLALLSEAVHRMGLADVVAESRPREGLCCVAFVPRD